MYIFWIYNNWVEKYINSYIEIHTSTSPPTTHYPSPGLAWWRRQHAQTMHTRPRHLHTHPARCLGAHNSLAPAPPVSSLPSVRRLNDRWQRSRSWPSNGVFAVLIPSDGVPAGRSAAAILLAEFRRSVCRVCSFRWGAPAGLSAAAGDLARRVRRSIRRF